MFRFKVHRYIQIQTLIVACINCGELINGYAVAWSSPILPMLDDPKHSPLPHAVTEIQKSWIASVMYFGCIGSYLGGLLSNHIGRKKSLIIGGVMNLLANLVLTLANSLAMIYAGRALVGISMSWISVVGVIYVGEIASSNIRGIILTSLGVFHALGGLLVYSVGPFLNYDFVGYVVIGINVFYTLICCFIPESPMYYVIKNDEKSARSTLKLLGRSVDINTELKVMLQKALQQQNTKYIWNELFSLKCNRKSLFITVFLACFQQCSGIISVLLYTTTIFQYAGSSVQPDIATIIVGATFVLGTMGAPVFIEKYGRRILLMVSTVGLFITMAALGLYFYMRQTNLASVSHLGWIPLTLLVLTIFVYSVGLSIIPNTLAGEMFTQKVRGLGPSISLCSGWISGFVSLTIFGYILAGLGIHVTFWMFASCNALAFFFVVFFVPETKGKTLMEIQEMLGK